MKGEYLLDDPELSQPLHALSSPGRHGRLRTIPLVARRVRSRGLVLVVNEKVLCSRIRRASSRTSDPISTAL